MDDVQELTGTVANALHAIGRELISPRVLIQFALIALAAIGGTVGATVIRNRVDITALSARWPHFMQQLSRLLMANLGTVIFVLVLAFARTVMLSFTWPSSS